MSQVSNGRGGAGVPRRIGPRLTMAIVIIGVLLLMGFSIAVDQWSSNPGLSVVAGSAAVTLVAWVIRRVVMDIVPDQGKVDDQQASGDGA